MLDLEKAAKVCQHVAEQRARWGKHAGFGAVGKHEVLDALVAAHEAGLFDLKGEKQSRILANRQKAAAEARAIKYKKDLDELQAKYDKLREKVSDSHNN